MMVRVMIVRSEVLLYVLKMSKMVILIMMLLRTMLIVLMIM